MGSQGWKRQIRKQRAIIRRNPELREYYRERHRQMIAQWTAASWDALMQCRPFWTLLKRST